MKVKRQDIKAYSEPNSLLIEEFYYEFKKNAQNVDYLKQYLDKVNKSKTFLTIDEKLADIKTRVGFDLARKITNEIEKVSHSHSDDDCACSTVDTGCGCPIKIASAHSELNVEIMANIIKYIEDTIRHEPHLDAPTVMWRCRNDEGLKFNHIEKIVDVKKLMNFISGLTKSDKNNLSSYAPNDDMSDFESMDNTAEYYNHAEPNIL